MDDNGWEAVRIADVAQSSDLNILAWTTASRRPPDLLAKLDSPTQRCVKELDAASSSKDTDQPSQDLYRRAIWAPDGSSILAITESQQKHILRCSSSGVIERMAEYKSPSPNLDAVWYPVPAIEQPSDPDTTHTSAPTLPTWCFAESHRDLPIRLTCSNDGRTRTSYSIMNHVEKFVGPYSLAFSPDLSRLYCGLYSSLAVLPLSRPGLNSHSHVPLISNKRSIGGQRGIISALATSPHPSEPGSHELVAVGTLSGTVGVYDLIPASFPEPTEHIATPTATSDGQESLAQSSLLAGWSEIEGDGITQLKFHPLTPYVLFVASRRSDYIYVYDVRYLMGDTSRWMFKPLARAAAGVRSAHLLAKLPRYGGASHQRMYFDVDWAGRWLASGDENGKIHLWRIDTGRFMDQSKDETSGAEDEPLELKPDFDWKAHEDTVGSVSFHPYQPWLASVAGSRRWPQAGAASDSDDSDESSKRGPAWTTKDSSLNIWDFSHPPISAC
ncbi:hypothetical protein NDA11_003035 [Ustilago hordei]|uniref:Related to Guanine nucleotide-binding protein beta 5 n=1 Tax=Ustilago hordei TaxID=120017 RepID=I2FPJ7_USTHO|nr:uncharacterized protein UHO2_04692 [Ustilago hordei]KAJ1041724.1 hypothetical protein NDA10_005309 [Ustilago hordei]KAJ1575498.1 hypothetical protein NDA15_004554 [Ustilago hordei]KAJ1577329.1 hypothetical protein NDA12_006258 [Ustilago hordei]KAJ1595130.1 hypothetical protein NDA11_003035 [Ustilago hordei]KAJ1597026.1 hypothetical protein NDA14_003525 [Ustilago hordei]